MEGAFGDLGIATVTIALLAGAVIGRLHPGARELGATGDRVFCGLLAIPWFVLLAHIVFPTAHLGWKLAAPVPILIYTLLLAGTDWKTRIAIEHFTLSLVIAVLLFYAFTALALWWSAA